MARKADVDKKVCVACGVCVKACPKQAIYIHKGCYAVVKEELCVGCGIPWDIYSSYNKTSS